MKLLVHNGVRVTYFFKLEELREMNKTSLSLYLQFPNAVIQIVSYLAYKLRD